MQCRDRADRGITDMTESGRCDSIRLPRRLIRRVAASAPCRVAPDKSREDKAGKAWLSYNSGTYLHQTLYVRHGAPYNPKITARLNKCLGAITDEAVK